MFLVSLLARTLIVLHQGLALMTSSDLSDALRSPTSTDSRTRLQHMNFGGAQTFSSVHNIVFGLLGEEKRRGVKSGKQKPPAACVPVFRVVRVQTVGVEPWAPL